MQRLVSVETMAGYVCEGCRGTCTARKQLSLCKLPPVLIFHVKRFRHGIKVNETLAFAPEELLDMRPYTTAAVLGGVAALEGGGGQYRLDCLVEHIGRTMNGGHYIAYVRHGAQWLKCDDMKVSPVRAYYGIGICALAAESLPATLPVPVATRCLWPRVGLRKLVHDGAILWL